MSTLRVSNIEAKADASSPTIDEKVKVTSSQGRVLVQIDGKTAGITSIGINTTSTSFTIDANQNVQFVGVITAANVNTTGISTFTSLNVTGQSTLTNVNVTGQSTLTNVNVSGVSTSSRLNVGTSGTVITTTASGLVGIGTTNPGVSLAISGTSGGSYLDIYNGGDIRLFGAGQHTGSAQNVSIYCDTSSTLGVGGTINYTGTLQQNGSNVIQWVELTPGVTEWSWSSSVVSQAITLNPSTIPSTARYVLADVFVTASTSDHQNIVLGRDVLTNQKNWVETRGQQPSGQFGTLTRQAVTLTYNGESDGYTPNYGLWYSSQHVPCSGRTIYFNNLGQTGSSGWVYVVVKAYSL
jgi:hypothetical protein